MDNVGPSPRCAKVHFRSRVGLASTKLDVALYASRHATVDPGDEVRACFCVGVVKSPEMKIRKRTVSAQTDTGRSVASRHVFGFVA